MNEPGSNDEGFALFDTPVGACGIAWSAQALVGVQLPEADEQATRERMQRRFPCLHEAPPNALAQDAITRMQAVLAGAPDDMQSIALDMRGVPEFNQRVYALARAIPPGQTRTYGELAVALGDKTLARAVGQALGHNPFAPVVPCHRILAAGNKPGGFSAGGGAMTKLKMLHLEGAQPNRMNSLFDAPWG